MTDTLHTASASFSTMPELLESWAQRQPEKLAVVSDRGELTYAQLARGVQEIATGLTRAGVRRGDAVGLVMPNGWQWVAACLGIMHAGAVCVPINTWYKNDEIQTAIVKTKIRLLVGQRKFYGTDYGAVLDDVASKAAASDADFVGIRYWHPDASLPEGFESSSGNRIDHPVCDAEDPGLYVFTSGSSAEPKAVVLRQGLLAVNGFEIGRHMEIRPDDRVWFANPMFFSYGCANALPMALAHGLTFCVQERFEPDAAGTFIEKHQCTVFYGLGPVARALVGARIPERYDISSLRTGSTGFSADDKRLVVEKLDIPGICSAYGLTEAYGHSSVSFSSDPIDIKLSTQGRVLSTQRIRILDSDGATILRGATGRWGEIQISGAVTTGYLNDESANATSFTDDGWFRTGDLGFLDADGLVHYAGRIKEIVKVNGITVSPAEVEGILHASELVSEAYCFGWQPPGFNDEVLCAALVLTEQARDVSDLDATLRTWMRQRAASYKVPAVFRVLEPGTVPTTATGKISKRLIGELYLSDSRVSRVGGQR